MTKVIYSRSMPIHEADLSPKAGCYILFANSEGMQHLGLPQENGLSVLYVGKAEDSIRKRVLKTHLDPKRSGSSTLRRSLGAMLLKRLNLTPQPRSDNTEDKKRFTIYKFDSGGEDKLTDWIKAHIFVTPVRSPNPKAVEDQLIADLSPPLNLTNSTNPYKNMIKNKRKVCVQRAKKFRSVR